MGIGDRDEACGCRPPVAQQGWTNGELVAQRTERLRLGTFPVEISVGKRISGRHRVPLRASVDVSTGEVRFHVDPEGIEILQSDAGGR